MSDSIGITHCYATSVGLLQMSFSNLFHFSYADHFPMNMLVQAVKPFKHNHTSFHISQTDIAAFILMNY